RVTYLERIEHYRERYHCMVYAYVLMSNHVHLLIETGVAGLSKIMQGIQFSYTQRYNRRHRMRASISGTLQSHPVRSRCVFVGAGSLHSFEPGADETSTRSLAISLEQSSVIRRSGQSGKNSDKRCAEAVRV